jgi:hypothetical protein
VAPLSLCSAYSALLAFALVLVMLVPGQVLYLWRKATFPPGDGDHWVRYWAIVNSRPWKRYERTLYVVYDGCWPAINIFAALTVVFLVLGW